MVGFHIPLPDLERLQAGLIDVESRCGKGTVTPSPGYEQQANFGFSAAWADDDDLIPNPSALCLRGFSAAMRDLWKAAFEGLFGRLVSGARNGARSKSVSSGVERRPLEHELR